MEYQCPKSSAEEPGEAVNDGKEFFVQGLDVGANRLNLLGDVVRACRIGE